MNRVKDEIVMHFRIGAVHASVSTPIRALRRQYLALYRDFQVQRPADDSIRIEVKRGEFSLGHRRRYAISVNSRPRFEPTRFDEVLPYIEWTINWELAHVMRQYLQLHASSMEIDGRGVIFPGVSGSGKSTLTVGMITRGWRYLCDELALIHAKTLQIHPFPRAICIKTPAFPVVESLGIRTRGARHYHKGFKGDVTFFNPLSIRPNSVGRVCPIRYVIFPTYTRGAAPALTPISRAQAVFDLHRVCFNLLGCRTLGVNVLAAMIRGADCYQLVSGEISETCDLLGRLVKQEGMRSALSA
ncbi:MAG: hypothetical protein JSU63_15825 [Phycisphaerales bacterium]|nr:MAG: hypothetical protein JSU63_15825 [Phycisphaerales bacterium]